MKIIIGRFDDAGEPVWFEVESNDWKDEDGNWKPMAKEAGGSGCDSLDGRK